MTFAAAPEYPVFPTRSRPLRPYEAVVRAAAETRPLVAAARPDVVVADILTLAPALAAELEGVPAATLVPHVFPAAEPGFPPYSFGARLPRTAAGRAAWRLLDRPVEGGVRRGRAELNETRVRLGLPPLAHLHGGISRKLALVATFPQLEYPARVARVGARRRALDVGAAVRGGRAAARRRHRSCSWRRRPPRTPRTGCCAPPCGAWRTPRCGSWRRPTAGPSPRRSTSRATRASSTGSPIRARCRAATSCSATAATGRSYARWRAAAPSSPCPRPATCSRTPPASTGPASAYASPAACARRAPCASPSSAAWRTRPCAPAPVDVAAWAKTHDPAARAAELVEGLAPRETTGQRPYNAPALPIRTRNSPR